MQKQIHIFYRTIFLTGLLSVTLFSRAQAQWTTVEKRKTDITIPSTVTSIYIELKGGDGGNAYADIKDLGGVQCHAYGGAGAVVKAVFNIGNGSNEIPPRSTIRFIRGEKGGAEQHYGKGGISDAAGGGGGGSALLYRKAGSTSSDDWVILAVAGGGGGAFAAMAAWTCTDNDNGQGGRTTTYGGDGTIQSLPDKSEGGKNGGAGHTITTGQTSGGGAGFNNSAENAGADTQDGQAGYPKGGDGGDRGGWGFGGGGFARLGPGGGGGYSGGGAGSLGGAGGGGSFIHTWNVANRLTAGRNGAGQEADGFGSYQFDPNEELISTIMTRSIHFATNTNKCLNNKGGSTANGTNIQTNNCDGDKKEKWIFDSDNQQLRVGDVQNKCINLPGASTSNGNNIELKDCNNTWGQRWYYNVINKSLHTGADLDKCMEVNNGFIAPGANNNIQIYDCQYGNSTQQWEITNATAVEDSNAKLSLVPWTKQSLAIHSHTDTEVGSNIQLWTYSTTNTAMKWQFDGLKLRLNNRSDRCIDLKNGSTSNGTNIHLWECKDKNTQEWLFDGFTNTIRSGANPQKCLQVNGSYAKRANIELWDCDESIKQKFLIR